MSRSALTLSLAGADALGCALAAFTAGNLVTAAAASAQDARPATWPYPCSQTISGTYAFTLSGKRPDGDVVGVAMTQFYSNGSLSQRDWTNADSAADPPGRVASGSYTLNVDCTGTMTIDQLGAPHPLDLAIVIDENSQEIRTAVMNPGVLVTSTGHRISFWP